VLYINFILFQWVPYDAEQSAQLEAALAGGAIEALFFNNKYKVCLRFFRFESL